MACAVSDCAEGQKGKRSHRRRRRRKIKSSKQDQESLQSLYDILGSSYPYNQIAHEVLQCCKNDDLTFDELASFDNTSLVDVIDTWNFNTFGKKRVVIRGKLIKGIKKLKANSNGDKNEDIPIPFTKQEKISLDELKLTKSQLIEKIGLKQNEELKMQQRLNQYGQEARNKAKQVFDELRLAINESEAETMKQIDDYFHDEEKSCDEYFEHLNATSKQILDKANKAVIDCSKNINKYTYYDIETRIKDNCQLIKKHGQEIEAIFSNIENGGEYKEILKLLNKNPVNVMVDKNCAQNIRMLTCLRLVKVDKIGANVNFHVNSNQFNQDQQLHSLERYLVDKRCQELDPYKESSYHEHNAGYQSRFTLDSIHEHETLEL